jgi:hypothetical protein
MQNLKIFPHAAARALIYFGVVLFAAYRLSPVFAARGGYNGFDVSGSLVPAEQIESGGPPRDGIPALSSPRMLSAAETKYLRPAERILGVAVNGESRAYPIRLLNWHEVVNDTVGEKAIVITYCPLCGTGMVFNAAVGERVLEFSVSGLLYNSDMLLYDRQTESLWSQLMAQAVSCPSKGKTLALVPATYTSWASWSAAYPNGSVLDINTGHDRDYARNPYAGYDKTRALYFDMSNRDSRFHEKDPVVGLVLDGQAKVWPLRELATVGGGQFTDRINDTELHIRYSVTDQTVVIEDATGNTLPSVPAYWFAWLAFYPDSLVFTIDN